MKLASETGRDIEIFIDDAAQLFGSKLRCLPENADQKLIFTELKRVPAVLIRNKGAVCLGDSRSEAEAASRPCSPTPPTKATPFPSFCRSTNTQGMCGRMQN